MNQPNEKPMTQEMPGIVPAAVRELLDQRGTYRDWLSRLDEIGGKYRNEVADRVRLDYEARLEEVGEQLEGHRHELVSRLEQRRNRLDELAEDFERRSAELEEAELRFQVGEFDDGTWEDRKRELTGGMEEIEVELGEARGAVEALGNVLDELASGGGAAPDTRRSPAEATAAKPAKAPDAASEAEADAPAEDETTSARPSASPAETTAGSSDAKTATTPGPTATTPEPTATTPEPTATPAGPRDTVVRPIHSAPKRAKDAAVADAAEGGEETGSPSPDAGRDSDGDYLDELEFLESLSLDDPDSFDAVSRMLEDEEDR